MGVATIGLMIRIPVASRERFSTRYSEDFVPPLEDISSAWLVAPFFISDRGVGYPCLSPSPAPLVSVFVPQPLCIGFIQDQPARCETGQAQLRPYMKCPRRIARQVRAVV